MWESRGPRRSPSRSSSAGLRGSPGDPDRQGRALNDLRGRGRAALTLSTSPAAEARRVTTVCSGLVRSTMARIGSRGPAASDGARPGAAGPRRSAPDRNREARRDVVRDQRHLDEAEHRDLLEIGGHRESADQSSLPAPLPPPARSAAHSTPPGASVAAASRVATRGATAARLRQAVQSRPGEGALDGH